MEFIVVPPKACDPLDLVRVLKSALANSRGKKVAAKYALQIQEVADLRKSISVADISTEVGLKTLLRCVASSFHSFVQPIQTLG
jgi:hypothetical protein